MLKFLKDYFVFRRCKKMSVTSSDYQDIIWYLKQCGYTQGESSAMLGSLELINKNYAKKLVLESPHWSENYQSNLYFHNSID